MLDFATLPDLRSQLPSILAEALSFDTIQHHRDIILTAALPVLAHCLPYLETWYQDTWYELGLYTLVVGESGIGKHKAEKWSRMLGSVIHRELKKVPVGNGTSSFYTPLNTSSAAFYEAIWNRGQRVLFFESEISRLTDNLKQDWASSLSTDLRAAYHHEEIGSARLTYTYDIDRPKVALFIAGTRDQFLKLFPEASDGLYSRFLIYHPVEFVDEWISQGPGKASPIQEPHYHKIAQRLYILWRACTRRIARESSQPLRINMTPLQWTRHTEFFTEKYKEVRGFKIPHMKSVVKRSGFACVRMAALFTGLRQDPGTLEHRRELFVDARDLNSALRLIDTYIDHSVFFSMKYHGGGRRIGRPPVLGDVLEILKGRERVRYNELIATAGLSRGQLERLLKAPEVEVEEVGGVRWVSLRSN